MDKDYIFKMILATVLLGCLLVTNYYLNHLNKSEAKYILYLDNSGLSYVLDKENKKIYIGTPDSVPAGSKNELTIHWSAVDMPDIPNIKQSNPSDLQFIVHKKNNGEILQGIEELKETTEELKGIIEDKN